MFNAYCEHDGWETPRARRAQQAPRVAPTETRRRRAATSLTPCQSRSRPRSLSQPRVAACLSRLGDAGSGNNHVVPAWHSLGGCLLPDRGTLIRLRSTATWHHRWGSPGRAAARTSSRRRAQTSARSGSGSRPIDRADRRHRSHGPGEAVPALHGGERSGGEPLAALRPSATDAPHRLPSARRHPRRCRSFAFSGGHSAGRCVSWACARFEETGEIQSQVVPRNRTRSLWIEVAQACAARCRV